MTHNKRCRWSLVALMVLTGASAPALLHAQRDATANQPVRGQVREAGTGKELAGAIVAIPAIGTTSQTDAEGRFSLRNVPLGSHVFTVVRLGYVPQDQEIEVTANEVITIGLHPRPIQLAGITADVDRVERLFRHRHEGATQYLRTLDQRALLLAAAPSVERLVKNRIQLAACPPTLPLAAAGRVECIHWSGRSVPMRVFVDDQPAYAGLVELAALAPGEMYAVELWSGGTEVRAYTRHFAERLATGRTSLKPHTLALGM